MAGLTPCPRAVYEYRHRLDLKKDLTMPVNMTPNKKRSNPEIEPAPPTGSPAAEAQDTQETKEDREKALADAENKNLWDATEVIDMDKW
jgi:hypothetical protein